MWLAGEMVRAMSAQKRDLSRRLKTAESSNRQLRSELQEVRAGGRSGPANRPMSTQLSSTMNAPCTGVRGKAGCCFSLCTDAEPPLSPSSNDLSLFCIKPPTPLTWCQIVKEVVVQCTVKEAVWLLVHMWTAVSCQSKGHLAAACELHAQ